MLSEARKREIQEGTRNNLISDMMGLCDEGIEAAREFLKEHQRAGDQEGIATFELVIKTVVELQVDLKIKWGRV